MSDEPNIDSILTSGSGKVIGVPKFTKTEMRFVKLESDISTLPKDRFGIRTETGETSLEQFDLVIVPGRAFTAGALTTFNRGLTSPLFIPRYTLPTAT